MIVQTHTQQNCYHACGQITRFFGSHCTYVSIILLFLRLANELKFKNETITKLQAELGKCKEGIPDKIKCDLKLKATEEKLTEITKKYDEVAKKLSDMIKDPVINRQFQIEENLKLVRECLKQKTTRTTNEKGDVVDEFGSKHCDFIMAEYGFLNEIAISYVSGHSVVINRINHEKRKEKAKEKKENDDKAKK